jgi:hypothetical protein
MCSSGLRKHLHLSFAVGTKRVEKSPSEPALPGQARQTERRVTSCCRKVQECAPISGFLLAVRAKLVEKFPLCV